MKKFILSFVIMMAAWMGAKAMSFERAQAEALYLTDKMAYELNLNDLQYNDAYEINLDYFLSIGSPSDLYGVYYNHRINDLRCILYDWQYSLLFAADYFLRPVVWRAGHWFFPIYGHYNRGFFYYSYPSVYISYRGGHSRYYHHGGFYGDRRPVWNGGMRGHDMHRPSPGMGGRVGGPRPGGVRSGGGRGYSIDFGGRGGRSGGGNGGSVNPGGGHSSGNHGNSFDGSSSRVGGSRSVGNSSGSNYGNHSSSSSRNGGFSSGGSRSGGFSSAGTRSGSPSFGGHSAGSGRGGGFSGGGSRGGGFSSGHSGGAHSSGGSRGGRR